MSNRAGGRDARRAPLAVLGAGSWGTALAMHLGRTGVPVRMWARDPGSSFLRRPAEMLGLIEDAGFHIERVENAYLAWPRPVAFFYDGVARR